MTFINTYRSKLSRHFQESGLRGTLGVVLKNLTWPYLEWLTRRRIRAHEQFDSRYGLDTQVPVSLSQLETFAPGAQYANKYESASFPVVHKILGQLKGDLSRYSFIDLGSGKGGVLLIAAQYSFQRVMGVEFSETLHKIAQANISIYETQVALHTRPISLHMDANDFDFREVGDAIIFCNNPFKESLILKILDNIECSLLQENKQMILIYLTPIPPTVKKRLENYEAIGQGRYLSHFGGFQKYYIHRMRPVRAAERG